MTDKIPSERLAEFFGINERSRYYLDRIQKAEVEFTESSVALAQQNASIQKHQAKSLKLQERIEELQKDLMKNELDRERSILQADHLLKTTQRLRDDLKLFREEVKKAAERGKEIANEFGTMQASMAWKPSNSTSRSASAIGALVPCVDSGSEDGEINSEDEYRPERSPIKRRRPEGNLCHAYNSRRGCHRSSSTCYYRHMCSVCRGWNHGAASHSVD